MEAVVEDLRAKLRAASSGSGQRDTSETRLEFACAHGSGHVLVTGAACSVRSPDGAGDRPAAWKRR